MRAAESAAGKTAAFKRRMAREHYRMAVDGPAAVAAPPRPPEQLDGAEMIAAETEAAARRLMSSDSVRQMSTKEHYEAAVEYDAEVEEKLKDAARLVRFSS